ncbi:MAG: tetraacyldisaccharide 4'-kinase [Bryobacterales bacterium]|nr:tetraacyldisaccharide 4'-kinase [Bryobacterales bacterium]
MSAASAAVILKGTIHINRNSSRFIYLLYQVLQIVFSPGIILYLLYRGARDRRYFRGLAERLGFLPASFEATTPGGVWFHAVSVGEVLSAAELIRRLRAQRPGLPVYLSTTTLAGRAAAEQRLSLNSAHNAAPGRDSGHGALEARVFFAPLDYRSAVRRVMRKLRPSAVVILETEIWPNLYRESRRAGASLLIVNGRISDRALPRYRRFNWFFRHALQQADGIFVQSEEDARRYAIAGARPEHVRAEGNLKYDFAPPSAGIAPEIAAFLDSLLPQHVWIAASTMPPLEKGDLDEDDIVVQAFQGLAPQFPSTLLILAPRKPERFDGAAEKLARSALPFTRRSSLTKIKLPGVLLLDSIGELAPLFERASAVFMGGTLVSRGGHNILEPAFFAKPVIVGPHMENFAAIAQEFSSAGAVVRIPDSQDLGAAVAGLLNNTEHAARIGAQARQLANAKRGVADRIACEILKASDAAIPHPLPILPARLLLTPLSWIWQAGSSINLSLQSARRQSLNAKVVSIGSLNMGGAGKTPIVAHLAERLDAAGRNVAILTRGYRRRSADPVVVTRGSKKVPVELTGDEAQMFVRAGHAHVGIGADRCEVARRMEAVGPNVFLLDDGFQHVRLKRDEDIVLVDALDPLAGGVFPVGRRREPLRSLTRATAVIVTRVERGQAITGIEDLIRRYNASAPVFTSRIVPKQFVGRAIVPATLFSPGPVAAFCGLGNPRSFWSTLESLELQVAFRLAFSDHHAYRPAELKRLGAQASAAGAKVLVTTEKDMMNLPSGADALLHPCELYWLRIGMEIDDEQELLRRIL